MISASLSRINPLVVHSSPSSRPRPRLLRRAHGPLRLHRHLRARPPDGRRGRVPAATSSSWSASWASPSSATPAATSSPATAGRTASARRANGPRGSTSPGTPGDQRVRPRRVRRLGRQGGRGADMAVNLGTRGVQEAVRPARVRQPPRRHLPVRPAPPTTAPRSRTTSGCGAWATRWTARGRWGTRRRRSTAGWRRRPARAMRRVDPTSSWSPAAAPTAACRRSAPGRRPCSTTPTTSSTTSRCTPITSETTATWRASSPRAVDMESFIDAVVATADPVGRPALSARSDQHVLRRVERLVPARRTGQPHSAPRTGRSRPRCIEDDYTVADAVVVGSCSSRCCGTATGSRPPARRNWST